MSQPLFENLSAISPRLHAAPRLLLFLDFDGTLAPIAERPEMACLSTEIKDMLIRLSQRDNTTVAIISGRALNDIQTLVGIEHLIYAGNHGMEIKGQGLSFVEPTASSQQTALQRLSEELSASLRHINGVEVENKGLTASIHFRRAAKDLGSTIEKIVRTAVVAESHHFLLTTGKMVYEIRPRVSWNKGAAVRWIREHLTEKNVLAICLGDDVTDEDAFAAIPDGITVKVGSAEATAAHYHIAGPQEVQQFLVWLEKATDTKV